MRLYEDKLKGKTSLFCLNLYPWWNGIWNESYMNCGYEIKWSYDLRSYERNFYNCVEKPEKFRTSKGFEPVTSWFRRDALTNWAMKQLTLGAGHLWVPMVPWGMNQWWNGIWNSYVVHVWFISYTISSLIHSSRDHWNPQMTSSQRQLLHSSVG